MVRLFHDNANSHIVVSKYQSQLMFAQIVPGGQNTISAWKTVFDFYSGSPLPTWHFRQGLQTCKKYEKVVKFKLCRKIYGKKKIQN